MMTKAPAALKLSVRLSTALIAMTLLGAGCSSIDHEGRRWGSYGPGPGQSDQSFDNLIRIVKSSKALFVLDAQGNLILVDSNGQPAKSCTREAGSNQCRIFRSPTVVKDLKSTPLLQFEGSEGWLILGPDGIYQEICYNGSSPPVSVPCR